MTVEKGAQLAQLGTEFSQKVINLSTHHTKVASTPKTLAQAVVNKVSYSHNVNAI